MTFRNKIQRSIFTIFAVALVVAGCQKMDRPALGNYAKDANPPGGPLKFFAALDGTNVDSIKAAYGTDNNVTYVDGVSGKAATFDSAKKGFIVYPGANDFGGQTSFSVSLWMNAGAVAKKDHVNADGILAFGGTDNFWGNFTMYADHEASTSDSMILQVVFNIGGDKSNFITYNGANRIPHMYDGKWHHIAVTYDQPSSGYTMYLDGVMFDKKVITPAVFQKASVLVLGGFQQAAGIQKTYSDNPWMSAFPGAIDQVRLYGTVLSATDVAALFSGKM